MQQAENIWQYGPAPCYSKPTADRISRNHTKEFKNAFNNLITYIKTLEQAKRVLPFVHNEKNGLLAIDQRPPKGGFQLRLYIYPCESEHFVYITSIGDKQSQQSDIKTGHKFIKNQ